ncbi:MAG: FAD-binding oxidoreductase, partial [Candidatus Sumerlaeota bacterium]
HVRARHVIFCTGYESARFIPNENTGRLLSTYAIASEPFANFEGWHERCLIWETGTPYYYLRTTADNRVLIGGLDEDFVSAEKRDSLIARKAGVLQRRFGHYFPEYDFEIMTAWAGTFGSTRDGLGYLGEAPTFPGAFFVLGYGGNGITYSMIAAQLASDWLARRKNPDAEIFRFRR